ncbi:MAG TPA: hypothetical protein VFZ85_16615 [Jiangellaceae bacterium]
MGVLMRAVLRLLAVGALVAGIVLMHQALTVSTDDPTLAAHGHAAASPSAHAPDGPTGPVDRSGGHDVLHLCIAVAAGAALLFAAWLLARRRPLARISGTRPRVVVRHGVLRPPRILAGYPLLLSLCVMRT